MSYFCFFLPEVVKYLAKNRRIASCREFSTSFWRFSNKNIYNQLLFKIKTIIKVRNISFLFSSVDPISLDQKTIVTSHIYLNLSKSSRELIIYKYERQGRYLFFFPNFRIRLPLRVVRLYSCEVSTKTREDHRFSIGD